MEQNELLIALKIEAKGIDKAIKDDLDTVGNSQLHEVLAHALLAGGKRIRPLLTVFCARLCHGMGPFTHKQNQELIKLSLIFEYLHAASLLHDDVIDRAETRRGSPAANTLYGTTAAILAGDYLHSRAMYLAGTIGHAPILADVCNAAQAMVSSEFIQMQSVIKKDPSQESYFQVLSGKTAALIASACATGALYNKEKREKVEPIRIFGNNLGLAFQIIDDLLDYLGNPRTTGKVVGNDFVEGKMTLPLIYALESTTPNKKELLMGWLEGSPEIRQENLSAARQIIEDANGFTLARDKAKTLIHEASIGLASFTDCTEKEILLGLGQYVLQRNK